MKQLGGHVIWSLWGAFWGGFGEVLGSFWGLRGHHLGGRRRTWTHVRQKGGRRISQSSLLGCGGKFWPRKVGPGARQEVPRGPENRPKQARREGEEAM